MSIAHALGLDALVERRIRAAMARGEFDHLPGAGRPLELDDDRLVPQEMRVACRLLKNAGCLPPALARLAEVNELLAALARGEAGTRRAGGRRLRALLLALEASGHAVAARVAWRQYEEALAARCDAAGAD